MQARSQRSTYELLSAYRTFALGVAALQLVLAMTPPSTRLLSYSILGVLGIYSLVRLFIPRFRHFRDGYPGLVMDVVFCISPIFLTGGLASPFLFYSICPIIYAALIFPKIVSIGCASVCSLSMVVSLTSSGASQINVGFAGIYVIACFLIAIMPYTTNLSIYRRLEEDAVLKERKRLARELHDTVAQTLAYVNLKASLVTETLAKGNLNRSLKELEQIKESLDATYDEVRQAINTLGQSAQEKVDFMPALSHQINEFSRKNGIKSRVSISRDEIKLPPEAADEILHIVGEAMVNARKHAQATTVEVGVNRNGNQMEVIIKDDGNGFDLAEYYSTRKSQGHHGISIMKERAESLGGDLMITSTPQDGTEVKANIPLE